MLPSYEGTKLLTTNIIVRDSRAQQFTGAFIISTLLSVYWFSRERRAERQQERSIRAGDGRVGSVEET